MSSELAHMPEMKIYLNVYDLHPLNYYLHPFGIGAYHTGIQLFDVEFAFGAHDTSNTGVYESEPKQSCSAKYRQTIYLGVSTLSIEDILDAIEELKIEYAGCTYNLFNKNCNHFSNDLSKKLLNKGIPKYLNRLASLSGLLRCFIPREFLEANDPIASKPKHRKKDSIYLASKRMIHRKRSFPLLNSTNSSHIETVALTKHEERSDNHL
jgi:hypothetical protein